MITTTLQILLAWVLLSPGFEVLFVCLLALQIVCAIPLIAHYFANVKLGRFKATMIGIWVGLVAHTTL